MEVAPCAVYFCTPAIRCNLCFLLKLLQGWGGGGGSLDNGIVAMGVGWATSLNSTQRASCIIYKD